MATMASTSHGLSVFANTCVKSPMNPKTGLAASLKERSIVRFDNGSNELGKSYGSSTEWARTNVGGKTSLSIEDLQSAKEEEFYEKLQQLKAENEKVMQAYERLYTEKMIREGLNGTNAHSHPLDKSGFDREVENGTTSLVVNGTGHVSIPGETAVLSKKPPPGKNVNMLTEAPTISKDGPQRSLHSLRKERPNSAPVNRKSHSLNEEQWRDAFFSGQKEDDPDNYVIIAKETLENDFEKNIAKINSMWDDFEIPSTLQRRHSFSSVPKKVSSSIEDKKAKTTEWRHRITIPKPFNMSVREALKEKKKTSAQVDLELRRQAKEREEQAECEKKFKAQPAPSHIYLPLYDEIMEKKETRRKYVKHYCQELLLSKVKPFTFESRENDKQQQRLLNQPNPQHSKKKTVKNTFKAAPVPKHIFSPEIEGKLLEDEELRKIRIRMRSKELLRESSLPPNMAAREQLKEQEKKEKAKKAKAAERLKKQRPRSAHAVPDYDALYREFQKELTRHRKSREGTVVEPFNLETNHIRASQDKIKYDIEMDERRLKENRWPYQSSRETPRSSLKYLGALSTSLDSIPACSTKAADLRNKMTKSEKERDSQRKKTEEEAEARRRARENKLRRYLNERTDSTPKPRESIAARLKKIKQDDREREENYQRELQEMQARVESNPLLVEKFMKENARKEAEKKFATTLHGAGIDDYEVVTSHRGSGTHSVRSMGVEDEVLAERDTYYADETYTKGVPSEERYESDHESL